MRLGTLNTRSLVRASCTTSPSTEQPRREVVGVRHLVEGDHPRTHRAVAAARLAEGELGAGRELELPVADVLADGEPGDVAPRVGLGDAVGAPTDHDDQLHLPVDAAAHDLDVVEGTAEAGGVLREGGRHLGQRHPALLGVAPVVEADGEHLPWRGHRTAEVGLDERVGRGGDGRREVDERVPVVVDAAEVGTEATVGGLGDIGDAVVEHEGGASGVVGELHAALLAKRGNRVSAVPRSIWWRAASSRS